MKARLRSLCSIWILGLFGYVIVGCSPSVPPNPCDDKKCDVGYKCVLDGENAQCVPDCKGVQIDCGNKCIDPKTSADHCGKCGAKCEDGQICKDGKCTLDCKDGEEICEDRCIDTQKDPKHCGQCDNACKGGEICKEGRCEASCLVGQTLCGVLCVDLQSDLTHCGTCEKACQIGEVCSAGKCHLSCQGGLTDCSGHCVNIQTDRAHCGSCANACNDGQVCSNGLCQISCQVGLTKCGNLCVNTNNDRENCGACGNVCNSGEVCANGKCVFNCPNGQTACSGSCVNLANDPNNCGTCGKKCTGGMLCASSKCVCPSDLTNCSGVCVDTKTNPDNCGTCGKKCANGQICSNSACVVSCQAGLTNCSGVCRDLNGDPNHCGTCGKKCADGQVCSKGVCAVSCQAGLTNCSGVCVDTKTNPDNCGTCGKKCANGQICSNSACVVSCQAGLTNCSGVCRDLNGDPDHCGACGKKCADGQVCSKGVCAVSCQAELTNCSGVCRDLNGDPDHCGACGKKCASGANASPACVSGSCRMVCNKNWGNCDNNPTNGCETNLLTNAKHCGNCGHVCDANQGLICTNGSCACSAKLTDCKGVCVDTASDAKNCGACDKVCATGWSCCAGVCLDTRSDNANCGACNKVCKTTEFCCKSVCESYIGSAGVPLISTGPCNTLRYGRYANHGQTNTVHILPDFSYAGYRGGGVAIPSAPVRETLSPVTNPTDDRTRIQAAIDKVSGFKPDANGLRGAVLLKKGTYRVGDTLRIKDSGVILQGEGQGSNGTVIIATKKAQHDLIAVEGMGSGFGEVKDSRVNITSSYLPVGSRTITVSSAQGFKIGDAIVVERTPNQSWIDDLKMAQYGWTTTGYRISFERTIADIKGNDLIIDIPLVDTIENKYGGGAVYRSAISGRISQCGIENIRLSSVYSSNTDEEHAWKAIKMRRVENSWVRNVTGLHFGYAIVSIEGESRFNTVEDTAILDPKSQITGSRRYPFNVSGMSMGNLFQRCYSQYGRHNFVSGARVPGPNVWLDCLVVNSHSDDGPHHRWATGLLFDNTKGRDLNVQNRGPSGTGHGWSGAQTLFWNAEAVNIVCDTPKGAMNWAIGCKGTKRSGTMVSPKEPFGWWESHEKVVSPRSLYLAQLAIRKGSTAVSQIAHPGQLNGRIWKHLENWAGQGSILDYLPDPTCARGIRSGTVCCAPSCGTCGGTGCSSRPGGSQACCTTQISASGRKCSEEPAPCVM